MPPVARFRAPEGHLIVCGRHVLLIGDVRAEPDAELGVRAGLSRTLARNRPLATLIM